MRRTRPLRRRLRPRGLVPGAGLWLILVAPLAAQVGVGEIEPIRQLPPEPVVEPCARWADAPLPPVAAVEEREEARTLAREAGEAVILGDLARARQLLERAATLDPRDAAIAIRLARLNDEGGQVEAALEGYCHYLRVAPGGPEREEASARAEALAPPPAELIPAAARAAFEAGLALYERGEGPEAVREFSRALVEFPDWAPAYLNRGLAHLLSGRETAARSDFERHLELDPDSERRTALERFEAGPEPEPEPAPEPVVRGYSRTATFVSGALIPGMGHFSTGRPGRGAFVLAAAGGAAAAGLLSTRLEVDCLTIPGPDGCPPGDILEERETRPHRVAGLGAAAGITLAGALHAVLTLPEARAGIDSARLRLEPAPAWVAAPMVWRLELRF